MRRTSPSDDSIPRTAPTPAVVETLRSGTLHLGRTNRFFLGGGKALLNAYHRTAARW